MKKRIYIWTSLLIYLFFFFLETLQQCNYNYNCMVYRLGLKGRLRKNSYTLLLNVWRKDQRNFFFIFFGNIFLRLFGQQSFYVAVQNNIMRRNRKWRRTIGDVSYFYPPLLFDAACAILLIRSTENWSRPVFLEVIFVSD